MSKNISALSFRKGIEKNYFERMVEAAETSGTAETEETIRSLAEEYLVGDAITLGAVSAYDFLKTENAGKKIHLCNGSACLVARTQDSLHATVSKHFSEDEIGHICCLGRCHEAGAFQFNGENYSGKSGAEIDALCETGNGDASDRYRVSSLLPEPILTAEFPGIDDYYAPFKALITTGNRDSLFEELKQSKLRGRGGAGFPLSFKWQSCREATGTPKFIVCNADEGDPGAYIDKYLMEQRPHAVLLGMMVAGWFAGAEAGVLYIRHEYPDSVRIVREAIEALTEAGWLGDNIHGSGFRFRLKVVKGAGAYI
ncbi:MAG: NAD(P)H-dependent oxidoreductase subunit E, partial [Verrucomicrobiae bacterium]|nr:NAD(P)H-dependent oxidoreductase subunit E [Verrucomicrobiae bacterium]